MPSRLSRTAECSFTNWGPPSSIRERAWWEDRSGTAGLHDVRQCKDLKRLLHFRGRHTFHGVPGRVWERKDMCHHPVLGYGLVELNFGLHRPA